MKTALKTAEETAIESYDSLQKIVTQLESCNYECEGGYLKNNVAFISLKRKAEHDKQIKDMIESGKARIIKTQENESQWIEPFFDGMITAIDSILTELEKEK